MTANKNGPAKAAEIPLERNRLYEATFELAPEAMALIDIDRALVVKGNARARQLLQAEKGSDWPEP
ncbi:MAG: hypothetical protein SVU69_13200, partial [Pseudomonadota bacterium]|nr:hypothetical protein [Pseudomonadota bacterium]